MTDAQLAELAEIVELAKAAEQNAKEMSAQEQSAIAQKYQKRLQAIPKVAMP